MKKVKIRAQNTQTKFKLHKIENQQRVMYNIFKKLNLDCLEDWTNVSRTTFNSYGGGQLLYTHYKNNLVNLYKSVYPNYPWDFSKFSKEYLNYMHYQLEFMDNLFKKLKLKSLEDWIKISKRKIIINNGEKLVEFYKRDMSALLKTIYPHFPWNFVYNNNSNDYFKSIENQREFMDKLFIKFKLKTLDDWIYFKRKILKLNGAEKLIENYSNNYLLILKTVYPNYPFIVHKKIDFKLIDNQRKIIDKLFIKYNLNSLDEWLTIKRNNIGHILTIYYGRNLPNLLRSIYPYYPWDFSSLKIKSSEYFKSIENQRDFMNELFIKFKLISIGDWIDIPQVKIARNKGANLIQIYKKDMKSLLQSIYPNYPWNFLSCKLLNYNFLVSKLKCWREKYNISQKRDWYRLPADPTQKYELYELLKLFYPSEKWKKSNFILRTKKTTQRLLFAFTQKIYPSLLIFENYFHPKLISKVDANMELDLFIPALQLAMEYQGIQHYDDMPAAFTGIEVLKNRDEIKERLANDLSIKIIYIPYWWDHSLSSLQSSLQSSQ